MRGIVTLGLLVGLILYLVLGGLVFWGFESGVKKEQQETDSVLIRQNLTRLIEVIQAEISAVGRNCSSNDSHREELRHLTANLQTYIDSSSHNATSVRDSRWDVPGSIFFAMTVVTTIGYGNLAPKTIGGRVFCCFYAVVGIPVCLVVLVSIGEKLREVATLFNARFSENGPRWLGRHVRSAAIFTAGAITFLLIPSAVFSVLEEWSYGTAFYYSIVSLATIGFGDHVAGIDYVGSHGALYRLMIAVWIFLGLSWLSGLISSVQDSLQMVVKDIDDKPLIARINNKKQRKVEEENTTKSQLIKDDIGEDPTTKETQL